jgi:transposase InsO family protein
MRTPLCTSAVLKAKQRYGCAPKCILHSDHGSQFTSHLFRETLTAEGFQQSMGKTGVCFDNAKCESFWATLKKELIYDLPHSSMTRQQIHDEIFTWIETYYNRRRRHTSNEGKLPPIVKRERYYSEQSAVA